MDYVRPLTPEREAKFRKTIAQRQPDLTVVLENVIDVHNISAIMRTCETVGVSEIHIIDNENPQPRKLGKRAAASARKWMTVQWYQNADACFAQLRTQGMKIWVTHLNEGGEKTLGLYDLNLTQPLALVFGNEHAGLTKEALALADGNFIIPMKGMVQSLNVSVAASVVLYEAMRQREIAGAYNISKTSAEETQRLINEWSNKNL